MTHLKTGRWLILFLIFLAGLTASAQAGRKPNFIIINQTMLSAHSVVDVPTTVVESGRSNSLMS